MYRDLRRSIFLTVGLSFFAIAHLQCSKSKEEESNTNPGNNNSKKPNIIVIVAESHRAEALGIMGNSVVQTPNLDKLANDGIAFINSYVTTAVCAVSRASILSGQYQERHKINSFAANFTSSALSQTYPLLLKNAGYKIGWVGMFGVGNTPPASSFNYWQENLPWQSNGVHNTDLVQQKVFEFLDRYRGEQFCLSVNFNAAHEVDGTPATYLVQDRYKNTYSGAAIAVPETADPKYWNSFPDFFRTDQNIARQRWYGFFSTTELLQNNTRNYYRLLTGVDEAVGSIVQKLKNLGIADNTIIIYTSDHGFSLGEHGMMGKWYGFEESIRVPMIIYDPRSADLKKGKVSQTSLNIDIAPTVLNMAGVTVPSTMQGENLIEIAKGNQPDRQHFFYSHTVFSAPQLPKVEGIVSKDFKYMTYTEYAYEELYNTQQDPKETTNLALNPSYAAKLNEMRNLYTQEKAAVK
ncbi:sulfatase-like hydrolase/transferase [Pseudopedobacter beijingensis]|uniref:Sulfatase-like hydrolase/transferase n=1 Tax=Pseudopedobacter beijingensis TaxID=1207056 RepID=A0ABW4IF89_9SPHI